MRIMCMPQNSAVRMYRLHALLAFQLMSVCLARYFRTVSLRSLRCDESCNNRYLSEANTQNFRIFECLLAYDTAV
jgi:hypothetical protein